PLQLDPKRIGGVQFSRVADQHLREIRVYPPAAGLVRVGKRAAGDRPGTEAQMVKLFGYRTQARFDVSQTLAIGELRESHTEELIPAGEAPHSFVAAVAANQAPEGVPRHLIHELNEHRPSFEHRWLLWLGGATGWSGTVSCSS